ncbi:PLC-like phosphodiesterase, partial [Saccharata proteae CBS 121410]
SGLVILSGANTKTSVEASVPTGDYITYSTTVLVSTSSTTSGTGTGTETSSGSSTGKGKSAKSTGTGSSTSGEETTTSPAVSFLTGGGGKTTSTVTANGTATVNATESSTSTSATPTNTQACNGYTEFCARKYSNITEVCAHNSPFSKSNNAAANQVLSVTTQLNDGIRMLQAQAHFNSTTNNFYLCHTSCSILNAGTLEDYLTTVAAWVQDHPYDVITILVGNADYVDVGNFTTPIENSGLKPYLYEPPKIPMGLDDWPTLSEMILTAKRVVFFLDYQANQTAVPYVLDEFSQMWETPFDPTNQSFPCTVQRPPSLAEADAKDRLYLINHNLNADLSILGESILVPNTVELNVTNANTTEYGSLGLSANQCEQMWGRPPNRLNVDYYNYGNFNGSVFAVAAKHNNVTYNGVCCG